MTVRIDSDFWKNYNEHKVLLRKCFSFLYYNRYPVPEGPESAYNFLVMEFFRKGLFDRFDAKRKGKYTQTNMPEKTIQKKFEQFIYKWTESVMNGLYLKAGKESKRFLRFSNDKIEGLNDTSYSSFKDMRGISSWDTSGEVQKVFVRRQFPSMTDTGDYHAEKPLNALEVCEENEIYTYLESILKDDRERHIVDYKKDGLNNTDIGVCLDISSSQVANILKSIRSRCSAFLTE